jgi:hypothetical protein
MINTMLLISARLHIYPSENKEVGHQVYRSGAGFASDIDNFQSLKSSKKARRIHYLYSATDMLCLNQMVIKKTKLHGLSPRANYTDRATAKRLPTCADRGCHMVGVTDPYGRILGFLDRCRYFSIK